MTRGGLGIWCWVVLAVALTAYLVDLGGLHIPHIGDEAPYLEITRLTAASGRLLPLETAAGLENTKPPLLFWTGIASTRWGEAWTLWRLRLPLVLITFATALLVGWTARAMGAGGGAGCVAALSFLAFGTTFQYGRPFLTNPPEVLFLFLPFAVAAVDELRMERWGFWVLTGLSVGVATLFKSFALVVPVAFAFTPWLLARRRWQVRAFLRHDLPKGLLATVLALACFALWPLLDPDPGAVLEHFVLGENLGKVGSDGGYLAGLLSPSHGLHMTLLGPFLNAVFLAPLVLWLLVRDARTRGDLASGEKGLWIAVLAFVAFYTLPSHRQANYLLPIMPALAVLLGLRWASVPIRWLRLSSIPLVVASAGTLIFLLLLKYGQGVALAVPGWLLLVPFVATVVALLAVHTRGGAPWLFHPAIFLVFLGLAAAVAPFEGPAGRFGSETLRATAGRSVYVPSTFRSRHERHRFLLPGADVRAYWRGDEAAWRHLYERGELVALTGPVGETLAPDGAEVLGRRLDLRTRQTPEEISDLLLHQNLDVVVQQEIIVRRMEGVDGER